MQRGFLIDMDGVIYRGRELNAGADRFINQLIDREIPFCFSRTIVSGPVAMSPCDCSAWAFAPKSSMCSLARWRRLDSWPNKSPRGQRM